MRLSKGSSAGESAFGGNCPQTTADLSRTSTLCLSLSDHIFFPHFCVRPVLA